MKIRETREEFKRLSYKDLEARVETMRQELLSYALNAATAQVKDNSQFKKVRKNIARAMTELNRKQNMKVLHGRD